ncbi:MAG: ion channel, partial [Euryarchaeota archaeon]|nr:ion channel [Euryarchaeota archaeon]
KDGKIRSEFLYTGSRAKLYEASYEVYNNLHNFYIANGRLDQASHVHYRRGEAHRKLRWARGGWKNWIGWKYKMRSIFDLVILNLFTGYGDRVSRPIIWSGVMIGAFAALFWHFDGIVKNVNVIPINGTSNDTVMYVNTTQVAPDWVDYLYHSITTFTSLGYSNIQPNLAAGHLPQVLVAAESGLGILMMALIIFVVTYQVSR